MGYRAHAPYVEIKLWSDASQAKVVAQVAAAIRREFSEILVNEGTDDVADRLLSSLATESAAGVRTLLIDRVTNGELAQRLYARAEELKDPVLTSALENSFSCLIDRQAERPHEILRPAAKTTVLAVSVGSDDLNLIVSRGAREKEIKLPKLASSLRTPRGRKWAIELALQEWGRH